MVAGNGCLWDLIGRFTLKVILFDNFLGELGFTGISQHSEENPSVVRSPEISVFQLDEIAVKEPLLLENRPCSVFGKVVSAFQ